MIKISKSATEAPAPRLAAPLAGMSRVWRGVKQVAKDFGDTYKSAKAKSEKELGEQRSYISDRDFKPKKFNIENKNNDQLNSEISNYFGEDRIDFIKKVLRKDKDTLSAEALIEAADKLSNLEKPFTSALYKTLELLQSKNKEISEIAVKLIERAPEDFLDIFSSKGTAGLFDKNDFQIKAISYFNNHDGDFKKLRNPSNSSWLSADKMKKSIANLSKEEQQKMKSKRFSKRENLSEELLKNIKNYIKRNPNNAFVKMVQEENYTDAQLLEARDFFESLIKEESNA